MKYQCVDCGDITDEWRRLKIRNGVYKCVKCLGRLEEVKNKELLDESRKDC